jgi:hypothetical protein
MAGNVVQMDYGTINKVAQGFSETEDALKLILRLVQAAIQVLKDTAFLSGPIGAAMLVYFETIRQKATNLQKICHEFAGDLRAAVQDHVNGDVEGKSYFGEGVRR